MEVVEHRDASPGHRAGYRASVAYRFIQLYMQTSHSVFLSETGYRGSVSLMGRLPDGGMPTYVR